MAPRAMPRGPVTVAYAFLDLNDGGAQRLTLGACRYLTAWGYRPIVVCVREAGALVDSAVAEGLPVHVLGRLQRPFDAGAPLAIGRHLRRLGVDVVHVPLYSRVSPYVRTGARLARVRLVVAHEWCRPGPPSPARRGADRLLGPGTRYVTASRAHARQMVAAGAPRDDVAVVYSGIDLDRFTPADRGAARRHLGLPSDRPIVLVPARLHPMKGHVDLLAALLTVRQRVPGVLALCAGDGPLRDVLPALVEGAGLGETVAFLGQRDDMPRLMAASDVVALASRIEGVPSVVMEAFASRRAVVATAVGGVPEAVRDGVTGWLVPSRDAVAFADALSEALSDRRLRDARAERAWVFARRRFGAEDGARQLAEAYDRWLGRTSPGAPGARPGVGGGVRG